MESFVEIVKRFNDSRGAALLLFQQIMEEEGERGGARERGRRGAALERMDHSETVWMDQVAAAQGAAFESKQQEA